MNPLSSPSKWPMQQCHPKTFIGTYSVYLTSYHTVRFVQLKCMQSTHIKTHAHGLFDADLSPSDPFPLPTMFGRTLCQSIDGWKINPISQLRAAAGLSCWLHEPLYALILLYLSNNPQFGTIPPLEQNVFPKRSSFRSPCTVHIQAIRKANRTVSRQAINCRHSLGYPPPRRCTSTMVRVAAQRRVDDGGNGVLGWWVQLMHRAHLNEQQHTLIFVLWPSLINAYHVVDACSKRTTLEHAINIAQTKAHARRVQHAVAAIPSAHSSNGRDVGTCTPAAEDYVSLCAWVHRDEVAEVPYARVGVMCYDLVDETVASRISLLVPTARD